MYIPKIVEGQPQSPLIFPGAERTTPTVSVVIPTLNEAKNLPHVLPRIPKWIDEVVIVDGRSSDNTVEVATQLLPKAKIVMETRKGKGAALRAGFSAASGDIIVMLDADGSMAPEEITLFVGALLAGAEFVKGSRFMQGGGTSDMEFHRYLGNYGLLMVARLLFGGRYSDLCYGYAAFWKHTLPALNLQSDGFEIETEMNVRALRTKLKISEVPSFESERINGTSNLNAIRDGLRIVRTMLVEYFHRQN
ncbi:MAG: glycosyl transferase [Anaerolineaceae bacterium]|nr:glycosyl transferase [Anaerolineaceae bacterium]